jgi:glycosidase
VRFTLNFSAKRTKSQMNDASDTLFSKLPLNRTLAFLVLLHIGVTSVFAQANSNQKLHVPSPDWRDQIIYFVVTDRFADGNSHNNDQGANEYKAGNNQFYQGGDLQGLTNQLDYIRGLGATSVWITPPVLNRWLDPRTNTAGYHGYWASDFSKIDPHLGSLADLQNLSKQLHARGMYLIQDIVLNHTANFFWYEGGWNKNKPSAFYQNDGQPSQWPFMYNDPRKPRDRAKGIYHWTPDVTDYRNAMQRESFQMSGLDDLNTSNPIVRQTLRKNYGDWIRKAGIDAFRLDTAFYVSPKFLIDFMNSRDPFAPGMKLSAKQTGRNQFLVFGEGFAIDQPYATTGQKSIAQYMPALPSMLNFPLYGSLLDTFARGAPPTVLAHRINAMMQQHASIHTMPSFLDNHDVDRFLASADERSLNLALLSLFTLPGIPTIYYGTEQGFTKQRASMFSQGAGSDQKDHFNSQHRHYQTIAQLAALRKANPTLSRGKPRILYANSFEPGIIVYEMRYRNRQISAKGSTQRIVVAMNTADHESMATLDSLQLSSNEQLEPQIVLNHSSTENLSANALKSFKLGAKQGIVWVVKPTRSPDNGNQAAKADLQLVKPILLPSGQLEVQGRAIANSKLRIVLNDNWAYAKQVASDELGQFKTAINIPAVSAPNNVSKHLPVWSRRSIRGAKQSVMQRVVAVYDSPQKDFSQLSSSIVQDFSNQPVWIEQISYDDPLGDDDGPANTNTPRYSYPTDASWGINRQMDLRKVQVFTSGGSARIELTTNKLTQTWNPANGFDHVAFTVFIELPNRQSDEAGLSTMPLQNAKLPQNMVWHRRLRLQGWSNVLTSAKNASDDNEGTPMVPGAQLHIDLKNNKLTIELSAGSLGYLDSLEGAKFYISTWDYDGGFRSLKHKAGAYWMGLKEPGEIISNAPLHDELKLPLIMDDTPALTIKPRN